VSITLPEGFAGVVGEVVELNVGGRGQLSRSARFVMHIRSQPQAQHADNEVVTLAEVRHERGSDWLANKAGQRRAAQVTIGSTRTS
jgi:hypothetical protein